MGSTSRLILILILSPLAQATELVHSGGQSPTGQSASTHLNYGQRECARIYQQANCESFFKENPELGQFAIDCNQPQDMAAELKACGEGTGRAAVEIKDFIATVLVGAASIPSVVAAGPNESARHHNQFYAECAKTMDCKVSLYTSAAGQEPGESLRRQLEKTSEGARLQNMIHYAESGRLLNNRNRAHEIIRTVRDPAERDRMMSEIYPGWNQRTEARTRSVWQMGYNAGKHILKSGACYRHDVQAEAVCHGLATIIIPGTAVKAGSKLAQITSILVRGMRAEAVLGRTVTMAQSRAIQAAHEEENLRKKAEILRTAGFNDQERRKILEAGIAGHAPVATSTAVNEARLNLGTMELEEMINSRQLQHLRRRLADCDRGPSDPCNGAIAAVQTEFDRALEVFRSRAINLEKRLTARIEAGDESEEMLAHWMRVSDCTKSTRPLGCSETLDKAHIAIGDAFNISAVAPAANGPTPFQIIQKMDFLTDAQRSKFRQLMSDAYQPAAVARAEARLAGGDVRAYTKVENLSKTVENIVGRNPVMSRSGSKVYFESGDRTKQVVFDPATRYFTVRYKAQSGDWRYHQMLPNEDGTLRAALPFERVVSHDDYWVRLTHFEY
jgi:hypothetical protein